MAHIWVKDAGRDWRAVTLRGSAVRLAADGAHAPDGEVDTVAATLRRVGAADDERWVLVAARGSEPLVNGVPLRLGIAVLADRDEIRWAARDGEPRYFSTERLAEVVEFPAGTRAGTCPRCKQTLTPGVAAVRCPGCGLWHHASETIPCWSYADRCAVCPQPTALDAGYRWTPEDL